MDEGPSQDWRIKSRINFHKNLMLFAEWEWKYLKIVLKIASENEKVET